MTARRIIRGLEEAVRHSRGEIEATTHRVTVLDYPARHIVIPDGVRAMPSARAGRPTARAVLRRLGKSATIAIAMSADFIADPRFLVGGYIGVMLTLASAVVWTWVQS